MRVASKFEKGDGVKSDSAINDGVRDVCATCNGENAIVQQAIVQNGIVQQAMMQQVTVVRRDDYAAGFFPVSTFTSRLELMLTYPY